MENQWHLALLMPNLVHWTLYALGLNLQQQKLYFGASLPHLFYINTFYGKQLHGHSSTKERKSNGHWRSQNLNFWVNDSFHFSFEHHHPVAFEYLCICLCLFYFFTDWARDYWRDWRRPTGGPPLSWLWSTNQRSIWDINAELSAFHRWGSSADASPARGSL